MIVRIVLQLFCPIFKYVKIILFRWFQPILISLLMMSKAHDSKFKNCDGVTDCCGVYFLSSQLSCGQIALSNWRMFPLESLEWMARKPFQTWNAFKSYRQKFLIFYSFRKQIKYKKLSCWTVILRCHGLSFYTCKNTENQYLSYTPSQPISWHIKIAQASCNDVKLCVHC